MGKFDYDSVPGNYQYKAMTKGPGFQRFWHIYKINLAKKVLNIDKKDVIIDIGCGSGNLLIELSKSCSGAYGADLNQKAIDFIKLRANKEKIKNIYLKKVSGPKLPFKNSSFDKVIAMELIEHLENPNLIIKECIRILKPGGLLFITTPNYRSFWPILETISDLFNLTPKMKGEQHISKFNKKTLINCLMKNNLHPVKTGSFYLASPFFAVFSSKLAHSAYKLEISKFMNKIKIPGMLLYSVSKK